MVYTVRTEIPTKVSNILTIISAKPGVFSESTTSGVIDIVGVFVWDRFEIPSTSYNV